MKWRKLPTVDRYQPHETSKERKQNAYSKWQTNIRECATMGYAQKILSTFNKVTAMYAADPNIRDLHGATLSMLSRTFQASFPHNIYTNMIESDVDRM